MSSQAVPLDRRRWIRIAGLGSLARNVGAATAPLESLSDWLRADVEARKLGLQLCLKRIDEKDPAIHAWVEVRPQPPTGQGPLSGIPFGAKDIIETQNLPTEFGSPIYKGRRGVRDAAIIEDLRRRGAVLLGKTQTAAFAHRTPAPTRNPRNPEHTPGGSSSGSAAAVAAGMAPFAIGTQTRGSILRPASYCGVTGFKPSYGLLPMEGVLPLAKSLDTLGFFTHTAAGMLKLWECLGHSSGKEEDLALGAPEPMPRVDAPMEHVFRETLSRLRGAGFSIQPVKITQLLIDLDAAASLVMTFEGAGVHEQRFKDYGARLDSIADLVREGLQISTARYEQAKQFILRSKDQISEVYKTTPVILTPAATGLAPLGLASTGEARMNSSWTAIGSPAISIPMAALNGLPLGLQLTADFGQDARTLQMAVRVEKTLQSLAR